MTTRIAITGPESTGKSQLAQQLAEKFGAAWVPEVARKYINNLGRAYHYNDILTIAQAQLDQMKAGAKNSTHLVFFDTELIVTKVWCDFKYGQCHPWILKNIQNQPVDLFLLTNIDLPWQPDPQREHPHARNQLFDIYRAELARLTTPFEIISGKGETRLVNAIQAIRKWFH